MTVHVLFIWAYSPWDQVIHFVSWFHTFHGTCTIECHALFLELLFQATSKVVRATHKNQNIVAVWTKASEEVCHYANNRFLFVRIKSTLLSSVPLNGSSVSGIKWEKKGPCKCECQRTKFNHQDSFWNSQFAEFLRQKSWKEHKGRKSASAKNLFTNKLQSIKPRFTDTRLIWTACFVPGEKVKKALSISLNSTRFIRIGHPVSMNTFYGPFSVRFKKNERAKQFSWTESPLDLQLQKMQDSFFFPFRI